MTRFVTATLLAAALLCLPLRAADKPSTKPVVQWTFAADPALPNVLILGDSISIGYTLQVRQLLQGKANLYRPLTANGKGPENCSGTTYGLAHLDRWLGDRHWAVIHFNFGLHDLKHVKKPGDETMSTDLQDPQQATVEAYEKNLRVIVAKLKATHAKLIFATTTPVPEGAKGRTSDMPPRYNEAALRVMKENDIAVDDLSALVTPKLATYQLSKDVHYRAEGYAVLAKQVATVVEEALPR